MLVNGVPLDKKYLSQEDFEEGVVGEILKQTQVIQKAVYHVSQKYMCVCVLISFVIKYVI